MRETEKSLEIYCQPGLILRDVGMIDPRNSLDNRTLEKKTTKIGLSKLLSLEAKSETLWPRVGLSKCGPRPSSTCLTWESVRYGNSYASSPDLLNQKLWALRPRNPCFIQPFRWCWYKWKFENCDLWLGSLCIELTGDSRGQGGSLGWPTSPVCQRLKDFPGSSVSKESNSNSRDCLQCRRHWLDPWVRKDPRRRKWQPTPAFLLRNPMDRGVWRATFHVISQLSD